MRKSILPGILFFLMMMLVGVAHAQVQGGAFLVTLMAHSCLIQAQAALLSLTMPQALPVKVIAVSALALRERVATGSVMIGM